MRHITTIALLAGLLGLTPATDALAQAPEDHLHFTFGGGPTVPHSEVRDRLGNGYNILFSVGYDLTRFVTLEGFLSTNNLGDTTILIPVRSTLVATPIPREFFVSMTTQLASANLMVQKPAGYIRPYGVAGIGVYDRPVELSTSTVGFVSGYCDPFLYVCVGGELETVEEVIGRRSSTDVGVDVGGGVNVSLFFVELRYHYIWGPTIEPPAGSLVSARKLNGKFLAFSFGVRF